MSEELRRPAVHWPYAAESCKATLDTNALEPLATRVLARSLLSQRLVAFVGAGVSAAYGRQTWRGLMRELWNQAEEAYGNQSGLGWPAIRELLWEGKKSSFLDYGDHAVKAQILLDMLALRPKHTRPKTDRAEPLEADPLQVETQCWLEDYNGFIDWICRELAGESDEQRRVARDARRLSGKGIDIRELPLDWLGLKAVLDVIKNWPEPGTARFGRNALRKKLTQVLAHQSTGTDSPLRLLIREYGLRRFMTTNYDHEIERGLEAAGFVERPDSDAPIQSSRIERISFGRQHTGAAMRFAVEGPRRHAAVLHLHGDVAEPASIIATESHYQQLYLDNHPQRDLVNNATLANFGANPILFVGSDVSEDDVLRPMRQFMSGEGHRADRMAVALFISNKKRPERAQRQVQLWLKYGVYALDVGEAKPEPKGKDPDIWLVEMLGVQKAFSEIDNDGATQARFREALSRLDRLEVPESVEGIKLETTQIALWSDVLTILKQRLEHLSGSGTSPKSSDIARAAVVLDIAVSWFSVQFLCCRLMTLRRKALAVVEDDSRLAHVYQRPSVGRSQPSLRHPVQHRHPAVADRFASISSAGRRIGFDEHIGELCAAIGKAQAFSSFRGRRVVIVSAARGHGKGAQFDRLIEDPGSPDHRGPTQPWPYLRQLMHALNHFGNTSVGLPGDARVVHASLSFSNELGPLISQVVDVMLEMTSRTAGSATETEATTSSSALPDATDQIEMLGRAMHRLSVEPDGGRMLLVLGNAGVLFDADGRPKNGQIQRVMRTLLSPRYSRARLDIVMYVGESQIPAYQRIKPSEGQGEDGRPSIESARGLTASRTEYRLASGPAADMRLRRRLSRLNIVGEPPARYDESRASLPPVLVHALGKTRVTTLAQAYFPDAAERMGWLGDATQEGPARYSDQDQAAQRLYFATGGSRLAQTLLLAWLEAALKRVGDPLHKGAPEQLVDLACAALRSAPAASAVEASVEFVLDQWAHWHFEMGRQSRVLPQPRMLTNSKMRGLQNCIQALATQGGPKSWELAMSLLWHLSAISHPVEVNVLSHCPQIDKQVKNLALDLKLSDDLAEIVLAMLELLVHWCLAFRIRARPVDGIQGLHEDPLRMRYTVHRHVQRHFLRLMGGRNIESTSWDQYTTTLYASLPDESPVLTADVHSTLVGVVQELSGYPRAQALEAEQVATVSNQGAQNNQVVSANSDEDFKTMVEEADRIRAAYYLVRSSYSLGVVSHLTEDAAERTGRLGHLEQYRRLVRWVTHAARYWERQHGIGANQGTPHGERWSPAGRPRGIFYTGELIWLYNECGVISLAQGKFHDAEQLLTMAETAARAVEADDSGTLHTRIRLHSALVQIERGRPHRARQILLPIAARRNGHKVPPLLAEFYLGQLDHLGGNYRAAQARYEHALKELRKVDRSRAAAFVLMNLADVMHGLNKRVCEGLSGALAASHDAVLEALVMADEAISLAQQGGHEDLRMMAILSRARICIDAGRLAGENLFEELSVAQRYAALNDIPRLSCEVHELRARLLMRQGEFHMSAAEATQSLEIAAMYDLKLKKARGLLTLADIYLHRGDRKGARELATMGREIAHSCDYAACVRGFKDMELRLGVADDNGD